MEKIAIGVIHEVEISSNIDLEEFEAELSLTGNDGFNFHFPLKKVKGDKNKYSFKIPEALENSFNDFIKYKVYVYIDNARFVADDGEMKLVSKNDFSGVNILSTEKTKDAKFGVKIKSKEPPEPKKEKKDEPKPTPEPKKEEPKPSPSPEPKKEEKKPEPTPELKKEVKEEAIIPRRSILQDYADSTKNEVDRERHKIEVNKKLRELLSDLKKN